MDGAYGVRGILDEQEVEFVAYLAYLIGVHVHASEVDRNDGLRFLVDSLTDGLGRNIPSSRIYVSEHRGAAAVEHAVGRRGERDRGHDDLVARADPCGEACDVQRGGAVGDCGDVARAGGFPNVPSKRSVAGPQVRKSLPSTSATAATSSSSIVWRPYPNSLSLAGVPPCMASFSIPRLLVLDFHVRQKLPKLLDREPFGVGPGVVHKAGLDLPSSLEVDAWRGRTTPCAGR